MRKASGSKAGIPDKEDGDPLRFKIVDRFTITGRGYGISHELLEGEVKDHVVVISESAFDKWHVCLHILHPSGRRSFTMIVLKPEENDRKPDEGEIFTDALPEK